MACSADDESCPVCPVCSEPVEFEVCWYCHGDGGFHDCGEDCCCCLDPDDDLNETCPECEGRGNYSICRNAGNHPSAAQEE